MNFADIPYEYHALIAFIIIFIIALILFILYNKEAVLKQFVLYAVTKVQETWGSDMGKVKFAEAYCMVREKFPVFTLLIREDFIRQLIEKALENLKNTIKENTSNKDISEWNDIEKSIMSQILKKEQGKDKIPEEEPEEESEEEPEEEPEEENTEYAE